MKQNHDQQTFDGRGDKKINFSLMTKYIILATINEIMFAKM